MLKYEIKKLLILPHVLLILLAFGIQFAMCFLPKNVSYSYSPTVYKEYMDRLSGEYTADKRAYVENEYLQMQKTIDEYEEVTDSYKNGTITLEEYETYNDSYNESSAKISTVEYILVKCDYFDKIGGNCTFFYDTDWVDFLSTSGIDYITAVIIILMVSAIFSDEYVSKSRVSVLTCFKGRTHTAICKLCVAFVFGFAISVCMSGVKYIGFAVQGVQSAENGGMCVRNLIGFGEFSGLTLAQYYLCNALFHSVIWAVCAVFICLVSNLVRSGIFTVFISFVAIVCTALLKTDSVTAFDFIFSGRLLTLNILDVSSTHSMAVILCVSVIKTAVYGIFSVRAWGISRK